VSVRGRRDDRSECPCRGRLGGHDRDLTLSR
jgi:hypothetical protein